MSLSWLLVVGAYPARSRMDGPDNQCSAYLTDTEAWAMRKINGISGSLRQDRAYGYPQTRRSQGDGPTTVSMTTHERGYGPVSLCFGAAYGPPLLVLGAL